MCNKNQLYEFPDPWYVKRIVADRDALGTKLTLSIVVTDDVQSKSIELANPDNEEILTALLDAERILISQELESQREFGTICIELFGESYFECWCDSVVAL